MASTLHQRTLLLTLAGSRAHGLHEADSDVDLRGCAFPPRAALLGYRLRFEQADQPGQLGGFHAVLTSEEQGLVTAQGVEGSVYSLAKFVRLCAEANPNLLESLFCREADVRVCTPAGEALRDHRQAFLSQRVLHRFTGYAFRQLKRIKGHRAWLLDPPGSPPARDDFGLPEHAAVPPDQRRAAEAAVRKRLEGWRPDLGGLGDAARDRLHHQLETALTEMTLAGDSPWHRAARSIGIDDNLITILASEKRYAAAQRSWRQYQTWKTQRNPARAELEARHGYDTKHGMHLVRLLRMGGEILTTGQVVVDRSKHDADELRAIRAGAWPYARLVAWAETEADRLRALTRDGRAVVPPLPDEEALDSLVMELQEQWLRASPV